MRTFFPSLRHEPKNHRIVGELSFCACYEKDLNRVDIERIDRDECIRSSLFLICDVFDIDLRLDETSIGSKSWPAVYEVGGRWQAIVDDQSVRHIDLHIASNGECCLGIRYSPERGLNLERFIYAVVIPFFYRMSYVDSRGIDSAHSDLWSEYAHGDHGLMEHGVRMVGIGEEDRRRSDLCACGSGETYKRCCLDEVEKVESLLREARYAKGSGDLRRFTV